MVIANPIYDVVFKRMMENEKVAKFFIGTFIDENIDSIEVKPQEYTYEGEFDFNDPKDVEKYENRIRERHSIWVYRLDFIAIFTTKSGEQKKVLIEIQKAKSQIDLMRFRNYLAEQYKKEDTIRNEKVILPITTIYILGFKLPEILTPCVKVERTYIDLINKVTLTAKSDFVEKLTHDCYVVQVDRITERYLTKLDKLLSVFEQSNFVDDKKIIKEFTHTTDIEEVKIMTDILHHSGTNPVEKKKIEDEQEAIRTINAMFEEKEKKFLKALNEKDKALNEKDQALNEKDQALNEKDQVIAELLRKLEDKK
jgi:molybdopterin converting factor small subunit